MLPAIALPIAALFLPYHVTVHRDYAYVTKVNDRVAVSRTGGAMARSNTFVDLKTGKAIAPGKAIPLLEDVLHSSDDMLSANLAGYFGAWSYAGADVGAVEAYSKGIWAGSLTVSSSDLFHNATTKAGLAVPRLPRGMMIPVIWRGDKSELVPLPILPIDGHFGIQDYDLKTMREGGGQHIIYWNLGDKVEHATWFSWGNITVPVTIPTVTSGYRVRGTDGTGAVGFGRICSAQNRLGTMHAIYWDLPNLRVIDLHPKSARGSMANAVDNGAIVGTVDTNAVLWSVQGEAVTVLSPDAAAYDVANGVQVGMRLKGRREQATLWRGSADSAVDLHSFLPRDLVSSSARNIGRDGTVFGIARDEKNRSMGVAWKPSPIYEALKRASGNNGRPFNAK